MFIPVFLFFYELSAFLSFFGSGKKKFMNLGYEGEIRIDPEKSDEKQRHHIALYAKLIEQVPGIHEKGKFNSAIEFGCGRGGGAYVLKHYYGLTNIVGIDRSRGNIRIAKKNVPDVDFKRADAVQYSSSGKFDLVLNLESSHMYTSRKLFFGRAASLMHENSFFVFGDLMRKTRTEIIEQMMKDSSLEIISCLTINEEVIKSLEKNAGVSYPLSTRYPWLVPKQIHNFFVTRHSAVFRDLVSGEMQYRLYLLKKRNNI